MPSSPQHERRTHRSERPDEAIAHQLHHVVEDFDLDLCLLVDAEGEVVASSRAPKRGESRLVKNALKRHRKAGRRRAAVELVEFRVGGAARFLATLGGESWTREIAAYRALFGARRILGAS